MINYEIITIDLLNQEMQVRYSKDGKDDFFMWINFGNQPNVTEAFLHAEATKGGQAAQSHWDLIAAKQTETEELELNAPLFPSQKNPKNPLSPNAATKLLKKMFQDAGVGNASSHSMRRTHGDTLRRNGADLKLIQEQLGHANIQTAAIYFGISDEERN